MSKSSPNSSEFVEEKRQLLYWITQWNKEGENFENINLDIPELSVLLQSAGFKLETFGEAQEVENVLNIAMSPISTKDHFVRIGLTCTKSGMCSTLTKQTTACKCPSEGETAEGQFWSVTGCGPSSQNSIHTSNSSLLPTISSAKLKTISCLLSKAFAIINDADVGKNDKCTEPLRNASVLTRHRSLDALKNFTNGSPFPTAALKRGLSWEVDPKMSPPKRSSSPVRRLSSSLSHISLDSGKTNTVVKNLETMKKLLEETLEIAAGANVTFVKTRGQTKRVSDIKPTEGPSVSDLICSQMSSSNGSQTPRKKLTPRKLLGSTGERKGLLKPSKISSLQKKPLVGTVSPLSTNSTNRATPKLGTNLLKQKYVVSGSREKIVMSKIDTGLGIKSKLSPNVPKENQAGPSGICRFRSMGKLPTSSTAVAKKK